MWWCAYLDMAKCHTTWRMSAYVMPQRLQDDSKIEREYQDRKIKKHLT